MVHSRVLHRLTSAAFLLLAGAPIANVHLSAAATVRHVGPSAAHRPILDVPASMLRRASVPVIVEMNSPLPEARVPSMSGMRASFAAAEASITGALHLQHARHVQAFHVIPAIAAAVPGSAIASLLKAPGVRAIVLDRWHALPAVPAPSDVQDVGAFAAPKAGRPRPGVDVPQTIEPESFALTGADKAQAHGYDGSGVRVAVIDSGIDTRQPDLANVMLHDPTGAPLRVDFTGTDLVDTVGHGTASASMIVAQSHVVYGGDNRTLLQIYPQPSGPTALFRSHFRVHGMAPGVRIMAAKIFDTRVSNGGGYDSWIVRAVDWAIANHADVISESFGGLSLPSNGVDPVSQADEAAIRAGITVVAADGNEGPGQSTISSPADAPGVIGVGASTDFRHFGQTGFLAPFGQTTTDNIASFTSRGPTTDGRPRPDLVAPGAFTWALFPQQKSQDGPDHPPYNVGTFGGTSQATPVTAGAAALVIQAFRKAHNGAGPSPALVRSILMSSAHDLGYPAFDQGAGRLDAWKAVETAVHSGPSYLLGPNSLAIAGPQAAPFATTFALTNSGSTVQRFSFDASLSHQIGIQEWAGTLQGTALRAYKFTVSPGLERMVGAVYWNSADRFDVQGSSKEVAMRVSLYDPRGRFANYSYGVGSGYASAQVSRPMSGVWTLVVSENGRKDRAGIRHYTRETFQARMNTYVSLPYGSFAPAAVTLAPGHAARIRLRGARPVAPGLQEVTVHVHGDHTSVLPVAVTSYISLGSRGGAFSGVFTGPSNAYFSLANENKVYSLNVTPGIRTLHVALTWPDSGYGVVLLLIDPSGQIVDGQFNGVSSSNSSSPFDLSSRTIEAIWSNPALGRWQVVVMDAVFAGTQASEPFIGRVSVNDTPVTPLALSQSVVPGSTFTVTLKVHNTNGPTVAEGYIGYATTDHYSTVQLGQIHALLGGSSGRNSGKATYSYTTGFVPPATRTVTSSIAAIHPTAPVDLSFADPIGFARAEGVRALVHVGGHDYMGATAVVTGTDLPIGAWNAEVTLSQPHDANLRPIIVGASTAEALTPDPWITFDHGLQNGHFTGGQPLILLPGQQDALRATVTVPLSAAPGVHHTQLFVYTVFGDQIATVPLTIEVQPRTGTEPASPAARP